MTVIRPKYILLGLAALFLMSFLYVKTQSVDLQRHNQVVEHISQFKQVDAVLNQHILEIRLGLLPYYDPAVMDLERLEQLQQEIKRLIRQLYATPGEALVQGTEAVTGALQLKKKSLESFKSSNAVLNNSLRYLPTVTVQLISYLSVTEQDNKLRQMINTLLRDSMVYNQNSEADLREKIASNAAQLKARFSAQSDDAQFIMSVLLSHVKIILEHKKLLDSLMQKLLQAPTTVNMDKLFKAYTLEYNAIMLEVNRYRLLLYGLSLFLLIYTAYILFKLSQTAAVLQRTVTDLNYQKFAMDQHAIISISDRSGNITYVNQKFCDISQRSPEELIGRNHRVSKSGFHSPEFYEEMWQSISSGQVWHGKLKNRARDGSFFWVDTTIVPFMDDSGSPYQYVAIRTDITEIKKAEDQLRIQSAALKMAANGIVITNQHGTIEWVNDAFTLLTGYARDEVIGQKPSVLKSERQAPEFYQQMWHTVLSGHVWHGELVNRRKDGSLYTEEQTISPVYDLQGEISHFIAIKQDITERRQTEDALRRSQKMEAIGQLSGGIAHDFNNQLGVIIGYLDFLQDYTENNAQASDWVTTATRATLRCMDLTRQLLAFSRRQSSVKSVVAVNTLITEMQTMIVRSLTPQVEMQYSLAEDLWTTELNAGEFQDAVLNMVINARDAMPKGGELLIETSNQYLDTDFTALNPGAQCGSYVLLMISDTGNGMDKETQERLFEPFYTTKAKNKGTGLGMSMVYGFVKRYGGYIKIYSEISIGTTIRLYLPRSASSQADKSISHQDDRKAPGGKENILIVDDEVDLLHLADKYLTELGYQTFLAENAVAALKLLQQHRQIDLLFSDVVMPGGINGYELAQQATAENSVLKVLLTSGFTSKAIAQNGQIRFSAQMLSKPYRKTELALRVRQILDSGDV